MLTPLRTQGVALNLPSRRGTHGRETFSAVRLIRDVSSILRLEPDIHKIPRIALVLLAFALVEAQSRQAQDARADDGPAGTAHIDASAYVGVAPLKVDLEAFMPGRVELGSASASVAWTVNGQPAGEAWALSHVFDTPGTHDVRVWITPRGNARNPRPSTQAVSITVAAKPWQAGGEISKTDARRFLWQAAFGPSDADIRFVTRHGYEAWIDRQFALPATMLSERLARSRGPNEHGELVTEAFVDDVFISAPDQLRQRTAWALAQVIPINAELAIDEEEEIFVGTRRLYNTYLRHALPSAAHGSEGNYEELLVDLTFNSAMATWLTYKNSTKANRQLNTKPDENYARELMQLFTVGLVQLEPNGDPVLDANGHAVPNYTNHDVKEFARVFTGMIDGNASREEPFAFSAKPVNWLLEDHDFGAKRLLQYPDAYPKDGRIPEAPRNRRTIRRAEAEVQAAVRNLFEHPSHPPFLARRMIQRFTTSNPSPDYIRRVAEAYAGEGPFGAGRRGDLAAMIKAVLLDDEARNPAYRDNPQHGLVLEPMRVLIGVARAHRLCEPAPILPASDLDVHWEMHELTGQGFLTTPSVFNFYLPDFAPAGSRLSAIGMVSPELQIMGEYKALAGLRFMADHTVYLMEEFNQRIFEEDDALEQDPAKLVSAIAEPLDHGWLNDDARRALTRAVRRFRDPEQRLYATVYLTLGHPGFRVLR